MPQNKLTTATKSLPKFQKTIPFILLVCGIFGLILAAILMFETIQINNNPSYVPNCSLNPILNCGAVIKAENSFLHGYSNPILGLITFPVLITIGAVLLNKVTLKRWFWIGLEIGSVIGVGIVGWLMYSSFYSVHALCPYCLGIWVVTITTWWYVTLYNYQNGTFVAKGNHKQILKFLTNHHLDIIILVFLLIALWTLQHFWYYYGKFF